MAFSHYTTANDVSGVSTWLENFLMRLNRDGCQIAVLLSQLGPDVGQSRIHETLLEAGIKPDIMPRASSLAGDVRNTIQFLNRHQPHVFLPQCLGAMYVAADHAGRKGLPWVMTTHSDDPAYWSIAKSVPPERSRGTFVGVSQYISELATQLGVASKTWTIPCGVPVAATSATFSNNPFRIAYSGRLVETQKRISLVLAAMVEACRRDPRIECVVMGAGPEKGASQRTVEACGLSNRIHFTGRLSPQQVQVELTRCQAILMMSDFEGLPVALLEAMALGVVPVARDISSGIPELVLNGRTGLLADANPNAAAAKIIQLANDPNQWSKCSRRAKERVSVHFSEAESYSKWMKLLNSLSEASSVHYPIRMPRMLELSLAAVNIRQPLIGRGYPTQRFVGPLGKIIRGIRKSGLSG